MSTTTEATTVAAPVVADDESDHKVRQAALAAVLWAPRKVRRGLTSANTWRKEHGRSTLTAIAWFSITLAVIAVSLYLAVGIVAALWHLSPMLVYGLGAWMIISVLASVLMLRIFAANTEVIDVHEAPAF